MQRMFLAGILAATLFSTTVSAGTEGLYGLGQEITYDYLAGRADIQIHYVAHDQKKGIATLMLSRRDGKATDRVQIDLARGEYQDIFVKRECEAVSFRAHILSLRWTKDASPPVGRLWFEYEVRVVPTPFS